MLTETEFDHRVVTELVPMRDIFASPEIPHDDIKFVKALKDRPGVEIIRKWGSWEDWLHDSAVVTAPGRHYVLVALTRHPKGDEYLVELARRVDDMLRSTTPPAQEVSAPR